MADDRFEQRLVADRDRADPADRAGIAVAQWHSVRPSIQEPLAVLGAQVAVIERVVRPEQLTIERVDRRGQLPMPGPAGWSGGDGSKGTTAIPLGSTGMPRAG